MNFRCNPYIQTTLVSLFILLSTFPAQRNIIFNSFFECFLQPDHRVAFKRNQIVYTFDFPEKN